MSKIKIFIILFALLYSVGLFAQQEIKQGKVNYVSSQLTYVVFQNSSGITEGDTLYVKSNKKLVPVLLAKYLSSSSVACENFSSKNIAVNEVVYAKVQQSENSEDKSEPITIVPVIPVVENRSETSSDYLKDENSLSTKISGRYSVQSYSNFTNINKSGDYQRWRHSLRFGADHIGGSGLSLSTYSIFNYKADEWSAVTDNLSKALKVYDLNLRYEFGESARIWVGRFLNRKISNISVVDGIQIEKSFSNITFGAVAGSRPNFSDFGFNFKLFEYGAYLNSLDSVGSGVMENTFSFFQQTNDFTTDRRFIYFQHTNSIFKNTYLFASTEIDLYKKINDVQENQFSLTGLYLSANYSPVREFSFNLSYDARKDVIYYETFKSLSEKILENETRQGFRVRTTFRPFNSFIFGAQYGYRYRKSDVKPSRNFGGYITYTTVPLLESSASLSFNRLLSNYVEGNVYSFNLTKSLYSIRSDFSAGFRKTNYNFPNGVSELDENAVLLSFSTSVIKPFSLSLSYEGIFESSRTTGRVLLDLTTRF